MPSVFPSSIFYSFLASFHVSLLFFKWRESKRKRKSKRERKYIHCALPLSLSLSAAPSLLRSLLPIFSLVHTMKQRENGQGRAVV